MISCTIRLTTASLQQNFGCYELYCTSIMRALHGKLVRCAQTETMVGYRGYLPGTDEAQSARDGPDSPR